MASQVDASTATPTMVGEDASKNNNDNNNNGNNNSKLGNDKSIPASSTSTMTPASSSSNTPPPATNASNAAAAAVSPSGKKERPRIRFGGAEAAASPTSSTPDAKAASETNKAINTSAEPSQDAAAKKKKGGVKFAMAGATATNAEPSTSPSPKPSVQFAAAAGPTISATSDSNAKPSTTPETELGATAAGDQPKASPASKPSFDLGDSIYGEEMVGDFQFDIEPPSPSAAATPDPGDFGMGKRTITFGSNQVKEFKDDFEALSTSDPLQSSFTRELDIDIGGERYVSLEEEIAPHPEGKDFDPSHVRFAAAPNKEENKESKKKIRKRDPTPFVRRSFLPDPEELGEGEPGDRPANGEAALSDDEVVEEEEEEEEEEDVENDKEGDNKASPLNSSRDDGDSGAPSSSGPSASSSTKSLSDVAKRGNLVHTNSNDSQEHVSFKEPSMEERLTVRRESGLAGLKKSRKRDPTPFVPRSFLPVESEEDADHEDRSYDDDRDRDRDYDYRNSGMKERRMSRSRDPVPDDRVCFDEEMDLLLKKHASAPMLPKKLGLSSDEENAEQLRAPEKHKSLPRIQQSGAPQRKESNLSFLEPSQEEKDQVRRENHKVGIRSTRKRDPTPFVPRSFLPVDDEQGEEDEGEEHEEFAGDEEHDKNGDSHIHFKEPNRNEVERARPTGRPTRKRDPTPFVSRKNMPADEEEVEEEEEEVEEEEEIVAPQQAATTQGKNVQIGGGSAETRSQGRKVKIGFAQDVAPATTKTSSEATGAADPQPIVAMVMPPKSATSGSIQRAVSIERDTVVHTAVAMGESWTFAKDVIQDVSGFVHFDHIELEVSDMRLAAWFYVEILGFTVDTLMPMKYYGKMLWINVGRQQIRLVSAPESKIIMGSISITVPSLREYRRRILQASAGFPEGTHFYLDTTSDKELIVTCPWGNAFKISEAGPKTYPLRIMSLNFNVRLGLASMIADFYEQIVGCVIDRMGKSSVRVCVGPHQYLIFSEITSHWQVEPVTVCLYVPHFTTLLGTLSINKLLSSKIDPFNFTSHEFAFDQVVDVSRLLRGDRKPIFLIRHRTRSLKHSSYMRPLVNNIQWDILRDEVDDEDEFYKNLLKDTLPIPRALIPAGILSPTRETAGTHAEASSSVPPLVSMPSGVAPAMDRGKDSSPSDSPKTDDKGRGPVGVLKKLPSSSDGRSVPEPVPSGKGSGDESQPTMQKRNITFGANDVKVFSIEDSKSTSSTNSNSRTSSVSSVVYREDSGIRFDDDGQDLQNSVSERRGRDRGDAGGGSSASSSGSNSERVSRMASGGAGGTFSSSSSVTSVSSARSGPAHHAANDHVHFTEPSAEEMGQTRREIQRVAMRQVRKRDPTPFVPRAFHNADSEEEEDPDMESRDHRGRDKRKE